MDIVRRHPERLDVIGLSAHRNGEALAAQAAEFPEAKLALLDAPAAAAYGVPGGPQAVVDLATLPEADIVVVAVAGVIGLEPTLAAIEAGKNIALASKEVLVAAGEVVMPLVRSKGLVMTPIDSEHSAVFQCLQGYRSDQVARLVLTASGGPFRGKKRDELASVSVEEALNHPTWRMGGKITVDSATLMNKGLEVIEAHWLFGLDIGQVDVVVHPQSIVHSFVEFKDTSVLAQCGWPDMRLPIQYALLYPDRTPGGLKRWNPVESGPLTFEEVDTSTFACLEIARHSAKVGRTAPCAMNAANEEAANAFLKGRCGFLQIADVVSETVSRHTPVDPTLENVLQTDAWARETVRSVLQLE